MYSASWCILFHPTIVRGRIFNFIKVYLVCSDGNHIGSYNFDITITPNFYSLSKREKKRWTLHLQLFGKHWLLLCTHCYSRNWSSKLCPQWYIFNRETIHKWSFLSCRTNLALKIVPKFHFYYPVPSPYCAANFCFSKGLCMIWNMGTLSKHKSC